MKKQFRFILMLVIISLCAFVANAQNTGVIPFVDEIVDDPFSDNFVVLFGYNNPNSTAVTIKHGNNNLFFPSPSNRGQPEKFEPGVHHRVITVLSTLPITPEGGGLIWFLDGKLATANQNMLGTLSQTTAFTYQGRLAEAGAPANGSYDLRFALFDAETAGAQKGSAIVKEDVQVTNGNFTVMLDFGTAPIFSTNRSFLEIGVRAATSTGAFTILAPRQPLTPSPYAIRAVSATTADLATNATNANLLNGLPASDYVKTSTNSFIRNQTSQQDANFNIGGNGTIGGTLSVGNSNASGTVLQLKNTSTGGAQWNIISTGSATQEGAGKLLFDHGDITRMILDGSGNLTIDGRITKGSGSFTIDHPLDPANKKLSHSFVESPDMMNIYNGNITTNEQGEAVVELPPYFSALNRDFRYQLTVIGQFAQAIVAEKIKNNQFKIKTDKPNIEVSWQITGIRQDKFANDQRIAVEEDKPTAERGKCIYAPACQNKPIGNSNSSSKP
jgi:hypothetical protein